MKSRIYIITCSHKELNNLKRLYSIISTELSEKIQWYIKDSGECEDTIDFFSRNEHPYIIFNSNPDKGIYNALNQVISQIKGYYMVFGASDTPIMENIRKMSNENIDYDFIHTAVKKGGKIKLPNKNANICISLSNRISSHSGGMLIRKDVHAKLGPYDETYTILGDHKFLLKSFNSQIITHRYYTTITGVFSEDGISSKISKTRINEAYRASIESNQNIILSKLIFLLRNIKLLLNETK